MKTTANTSILSFLLTLVMMVSCSTEGDILDDMSKVEVPATTGVAAAVSCSVTNIMTKADGGIQPAEGDTNESVQSVIFFLMKGNEVLGYKKDATATIYTKQQAGMTVIAVANASDATHTKLANATTRTAIYAIALESNDLKSLIKIGESNEITQFETVDAKTVKATAAVAVSQIAARIDLNQLTVNAKATDSQKVELTSVTLENQNAAGWMNGTIADFLAGNVNVNGTLRVSELTSGQQYDKICHFYTFANESATYPTTMVLNFKVDGVPSSSKFKIKHNTDGNIVKSGYLYRLNITVNVYGENVEPEVTFEVADWKTTSLTGDMEDMAK